MAKETPSLAPQKINEFNWYYEEEKNLNIIHEVYNKDGKLMQTDSIKIPLKKIAESMKRCGYRISKIKS